SIRFCDEVAKDPVHDMHERGNTNEITVSPGRELDNDYTLMTEHVCPVGALTSKDFRFKARVWFLKSSPGVCTGCATGCNTWVDHDPRYQRVYRLRPRDNEDVNKFWMCDDGMMTYHEVHENRVLAPLAGRGGDRQEILRDDAIERAATRLGTADGSKVAVVLSAVHSTEDNFALMKFAKDVLRTDRIYLAARPDWEGDNILRDKDHNPNRAGVLAVAGGATPKPLEGLVEAVEAGDVDAVLALGHESAESDEDLAPLVQLEGVVVLASNTGALPEVASLVLPVSSWAEADGTFTNRKGIAQTFRRAIPSPGRIEPAWQTLGAIAKAMGTDLGLTRLSDVRGAMSASGSTQPKNLEAST
ncbi:MAG: molybdopterin-dependent oxidoreductase, partial [Myxococcales bacterium]|nr:molybdopterin-dependent oxidoreductase [Myxococcales bacterium]